MLEEYLVGFIMAQVVMAASFQKGQLIIEVDERRLRHDKTWCVRGQCEGVVTTNSVGTRREKKERLTFGSRIYTSSVKHVIKPVGNGMKENVGKHCQSPALTVATRLTL